MRAAPADPTAFDPLGPARLLARALEDLGEPKAVVAARAGVSRSQLDGYLSGRVTPSHPVLNRVLRSMGREATLSADEVDHRRDAFTTRTEGPYEREGRERLARAGNREKMMRTKPAQRLFDVTAAGREMDTALRCSGLSTTEACRRAGLSRSRLEGHLSWRVQPSLVVFDRFVRAMGMRPTLLVQTVDMSTHDVIVWRARESGLAEDQVLAVADEVEADHVRDMILAHL